MARAKGYTPLIRRLRDSEGKLVTYLPSRELQEVVGICSSTISVWVEQGLLRCTGKLNGGRNYAVADAARLKMMTVAEARRLGIRKVAEHRVAAQREHARRLYEPSLQKASYHREEWDEYDRQFVIDMVAARQPVALMASALGRTTYAVENCITRLRKEGEIPPVPHDDTWQLRTLALLTDEELESLTVREEKAA